MNVFIRILLRVLIYAVLITVGLSLYTFLVSIFPPRHITGITPSDMGMDYEAVTLVTEDGVRLKGWYIPSQGSRGRAVIVCHGYPMDKGNVLSLASFLHEEFDLLFFDFRAMGESGGRITTCGWNERKDFLAAVRYLKDKGMERIGAIGFSMGGAVIIMANSPEVDAIVSESAYADLDDIVRTIYGRFRVLSRLFSEATNLWSRLFIRVDLKKVAPRDFIGRVEAPVFLIHSERDSQIPVEHALILKQANPAAELWIADEAGHGEAIALSRDEYERRVSEFLVRELDRYER